VEQQIRQGDGPDGRHARCEEQLLVGVWSSRAGGGTRHTGWLG
jgi:hypothetical protein